MHFLLCHYFIVFNIIINVFSIIVIIATIMNVNLYGNNLYYYYCFRRILCCFINFSYTIVVNCYYCYRDLIFTYKLYQKHCKLLRLRDQR